MDSITGMASTLARIGALENQLSTLRRPSDNSFGAFLQQAGAPDAQPVAGTSGSPAKASAAWAAAQRPLRLQPAGVQPTKASDPSATSTLVNGRLPDTALVSIGGGDRLQPAAAAGFDSMRAAAARDGVALSVNDSYRSIDEQEDIAARKGLYSQGGLAAKPGTSSHGLGLSVDLRLDSQAQAWMRANAGRFGFAENVAREPWHWTFSAPTAG